MCESGPSALTLLHRWELPTIIGTHPLCVLHPSVRVGVASDGAVSAEATEPSIGGVVLVGDHARIFALYAHSTHRAVGQSVALERHEFASESLAGSDIGSICSGTYWDGFEMKPFIALTVIKGDTTNTPITAKASLIVYGLHSRTNCLVDILDDAVRIDLPFIPFKIEYFCSNTDPDSPETALILPGADCKIHVYSISSMGISPAENDQLLQEIGTLSSSIMSLDIKYYEGTRITAVGCMNGFLQISFVDEKGEIKRHSTYLDGPISGIKLFTEHQDHKLKCVDSHMKRPKAPALIDIIQDYGTGNYKVPKILQSSCVNAVIAGASGFASVYRDILGKGLSSVSMLPESEAYDCVTFADPIDINADGTHEIIIGTFARQLHIYKGKEDTTGEKIEFVLHSRIPMPDAPLCCQWTDVTGDGIKELVVSGIYGVSVYQTDHEAAYERLCKILKSMQTPSTES
eukprot:TRINITY_DN3013_c0_g1_i1.p1 TRINITY_DN3013_c0_g1~~TRINITY_DN3013_c0_g1_i1.p1  ORF type:complete len:460 (+),score=68.99 TRINITY_DN3013_c0_g1_i1:62-1441(+)